MTHTPITSRIPALIPALTLALGLALVGSARAQALEHGKPQLDKDGKPLAHTVLRAGDTPSVIAPSKIFTGRVRQDFVARPDEYSNNGICFVTFEPGARTFWHTHPAGQRLLVTAGRGLVGTLDGTVHVVRPGDYIWCPPGLTHWHGAAPDTAMTHIAFTNVMPGKTVTWHGPVAEDDYLRFARSVLPGTKDK